MSLTLQSSWISTPTLASLQQPALLATSWTFLQFGTLLPLVSHFETTSFLSIPDSHKAANSSNPALQFPSLFPSSSWVQPILDSLSSQTQLDPHFQSLGLCSSWDLRFRFLLLSVSSLCPTNSQPWFAIVICLLLLYLPSGAAELIKILD